MEKNFISEEDKVVLRKVSKYLRSYNLSSGIITIEGDFYNDLESAFERTTNFSNNWSVEIPDFFKPYLEEIVTKSLRNIDDLDIDGLNYDNVEFEIDTVDSTLEITRFWGYEEPGDGSGYTWGDDTEDTEMVEGLIAEIRASDATINSDGIARLDYSGGGDSGYLESSFDGGGRVPKEVEDWCYRVLEDNYGGWEINEGSQGYFLFNVTNRTIELEHTYNEEVEKSDTIFSINFGKPKE
jgi:hypothetical protein